MAGSTIALISTSCTVSSAICMAFGWFFIRRGKRTVHRNLMIASIVLAALFFTLYMYRTMFIGNTAFGGPASVLPFYTAFLTFHITIVTITPVLVIIVLIYQWKQQYDKHRKLGRITAVLWFISAFTAITVYLLLYVIYPPGATTDLFRAYWGF